MFKVWHEWSLSIDVTNSEDFFFDVKLVNSLLRKEKTVIPYTPEFFQPFFSQLQKLWFRL